MHRDPYFFFLAHDLFRKPVPTFRDHAPSFSTLPRSSRDLGGEVGFLLLDPLAESVTHVTGDLDRATDFAFGFLKRLRDGLFVVEDKRLLDQTDFLVKSLQTGLDDLLYHVFRLALLAEFVGQHIFLALYQSRVEAGLVERLRIGRAHMHGQLAAKRD